MLHNGSVKQRVRSSHPCETLYFNLGWRTKMATWAADSKYRHPYVAPSSVRSAAYVADLTAKDNRLRAADQPRRSPVTPNQWEIQLQLVKPTSL